MSAGIKRFKKVSTKRILITGLMIALVVVFFISLPKLTTILTTLGIVPGPEGVSCSLYSAAANNGINVVGVEKELSSLKGEFSTVGKVTPGTWIAYSEYSDWDWLGKEYKRKIGYRWVRTDPASPVIEAVLVDRDTGSVLNGINVQVRIEKPTMEDINKKGDPLGKNPTQIAWYSYETEKSEEGTAITWKHYEVYVVPVDFAIELAVRPTQDLDVGDFKMFDLWFVIDTVTWINAFTYDQYALLKENPPANTIISAYSFRGGFPIWAWVGAWEPWQVKGRDGNLDKFYDPADLTPEERSELEQHLQLMPSFGGTEVTLYTSPGYIYDRIFATDIIKNPDSLKTMIAGSLPGLPDPRFAQTVYFCLTLINYGALKREGGWWITYWHKEYYPVSTLRIRVLYAIYGEWIYKWTKEEAQKQEYHWENRTSTITGDKSVWDKFLGGIGSWFSNPLNQLWIFFILLIVVVSIITILNPGIWTAVAMSLRKGK